MITRLNQVAIRIRSELGDLETILHRIREGWEKACRSGDSFYLDSVALNLHGLYSGLERLFELILTNVDGVKFSGENWHQKLLDQVSKDIQNVRPAVISDSCRNKLDEYRGFRHVVRNVYTLNFNAQKIRELVDSAPDLFNKIRAELLAFADFLEQAE